MTMINPGDCPYYLITRASLTMTAAMKKTLSDAGFDNVKPAYLGVLLCLWKDEAMDEVLGKFGTQDGVRLSDLGHCAGLEPSSMTGLIDRMERDGLVRRTSDPSDRRALKITLTEKALGLREKLTGALNGMLDETFAGIDPGQLDTFKDILRQVLINLNKGGML
jgi:DNA-binding MarR family transcriptional regulator